MAESNCVDASIVVELKKMKDEIIKEMKQLLESEITDLEKRMEQISELRAENYNLKFKALEDKIETHRRYHAEHFEATSKIDDKLNDTRNSIMSDIKENSRFSWSTVIAVIAVAVAAAGIFI
jgi:uncharacterized protein YaaR (DUF327 family)